MKVQLLTLLLCLAIVGGGIAVALEGLRFWEVILVAVAAGASIGLVIGLRRKR